MSVLVEQPGVKINVKIQELSESDADLILRGYVGIVSIGAWSASASLEAGDLGLKTLPENFKPGRKLLIPEKTIGEIRKIDGSARRFLESKSVRFGPHKFHFIHAKHIADVWVELNRLREQYFTAVDEKVVDRLDALKLEMQEAFPTQWDAIKHLYPEAKAIREKYYFEYSFREMVLPKETGEVDLRQLQMRQDADEDYRRRLTEEMNSQVQSQVREFHQLVEDTVKSVRGAVVEQFQSILQKRSEQKPILPQNVKRLREVIAAVGESDFLGDMAFQNQLKQVIGLLDATTTFEDNASATAALESVLRDTVSFAAETQTETILNFKQQLFGRKLSL